MGVSSRRITVLPENMIVLSSQGESLLQALLNNKISVNHSCEGNGSCGTCLIRVLSASPELASRTEIEAEMALDRGFKSHERLSCQIDQFQDLVIEIPASSKVQV